MNKMIRCLAALTLLCTTCALCADPVKTRPSSYTTATEAYPAALKVLLCKAQEGALVEILGGYQVLDPENEFLLTSGSMGKRYFLSATEKGLKWGEFFSGVSHLRIAPTDKSGSLLINGTQYKGYIDAYASDGTVDLINTVDVEDYLQATLSGQFSSSLEEEVLDALAIVARTRAYYYATRHAHSLWHLTAEEDNYHGHAFSFQNPEVDLAIERTRHMVLTYHSSFFPATWTENCAGKTATYSAIFRKDVSTPPGVSAPLAARERNRSRWSFTLSKIQFAKHLHLSKVSTIQAYVDAPSGKVYALKIAEGKEAHDIDFVHLQKALGEDKLLSNDFTLKVKGDSLTFTGFGKGAGVGLCVYSAHQMAKRGEKAPKILTTFFPQTKLENIRSYPQVEEEEVAESP